MSDTSRNHHYIPQFYLKGFLDPCDPKKQIHVIEKNARRHFPTNPRNVGSQRDFNRVEIPGLPIDDAEKRVFGLIDTEAARALRYIAENAILPEDTTLRRNLIYFVTILAVHNPHIQNSMVNASTEYHKQRMKSLVSSREVYQSEIQRVRSSGPKVPYEVARQFVEKERFTIKFPHGYHLGPELETIQNVIFPLLSDMQWSLIIAAEGTSNFVCSDRPVVLFEIINPPYHQHHSNPPAKPIVKDIELTMPLNLRMALHATFGDPSVIAMASEREVAFINGRTIHAATRQIYCSHLDFKFLDNGEIKSGQDLISACESSPQP